MKIKSLKQARNLKGRRVLVRVDFNVPIKNKKVADDTRILAALPTIEYLLKKKAKVILSAHLGRPRGYNGKGKSGYDKKFRQEPVATRLEKLLKKKVVFLPASINKQKLNNDYLEKAGKKITKMKNGQIVMLENMRFFPDEAKDIKDLSEHLAQLGDLFVIDGFAVAHRRAASVSGVAQYLPTYAGFLLEQEFEGLSKVTEKPKKPLVVVLGGAKLETKVPVLKALLPKASYILLGGALTNTYLKAKGYGVGNSLVDNEYTKELLKYCKSKKVILAVDVVVGTEEGKDFSVISTKKKFNLPKTKGVYDVGPETIHLYAKYIKKAQTLIWNGAMGYFEQKPYDVGTLAIARLVASRSKGKAYGVIGGGETLQTMEMVKMTDDIDLVSTGGGAMLEFLAGKKLPGVEAVKK